MTLPRVGVATGRLHNRFNSSAPGYPIIKSELHLMDLGVVATFMCPELERGLSLPLPHMNLDVQQALYTVRHNINFQEVVTRLPVWFSAMRMHSPREDRYMILADVDSLVVLMAKQMDSCPRDQGILERSTVEKPAGWMMAHGQILNASRVRHRVGVLT